MKKYIITLMFVVIIGIILWVRLNPPILQGATYSNSDVTTAVIGLGNKGFSDIQITEVIVNNEEPPTNVKLQIFRPDEASFIVNNVLSSKEAATNLYNLTDAKIKKGTIIHEIHSRQDQNQLRDEDRAYGLTVVNNQRINNVIVHYSYLKMPYTAKINFQ